jgi:uncharacterized OB-fold protein
MLSIQPGVFEIRDDGSGALIGGWCASSGHYHFPLQDCCPYSGATDVEAVELSGVGTLWGWTAVTTAPPGYSGPVPFGFGVVELTDGAGAGLRIITHIDGADGSRLEFGQLEFGQKMQLGSLAIATDDEGTDVHTWTFVPVTAFPVPV